MAKALPASPPLLRLPGWVRRQHPVVREEVRRWGRLRSILFNQGGWLAAGGVFGLALIPALCAGLVSLGARLEGANFIGVVGGTLALTAAVISGLLHWLLGLAATIVGATLIAREREEQRWAFLRVTPLTSTEIVGGKLASLLYLLGRPMHLAVALRLFALLTGGLTLLLMVTVGGMTLDQLLAAVEVTRELLPTAPVGLVLAGLVGGLDLIIWVGFWLLQPYFTGLYNSLVGLTASSLVKSRGLAIGLAFVMHLGLSLALYTPAQQIAYVLFASTTTLNGAIVTGNLTTILVAATVQFGVLTALQVAVMASCFFLSIRRIENLGD